MSASVISSGTGCGCGLRRSVYIVPGRGERRRAAQLRAGGQVVRVADATGVHELHEDAAALRVHRVGDGASRRPARR
jgi:hypothetical protein